LNHTSCQQTRKGNRITVIFVAVMILSACTPSIYGQWTQPNGNGHINSTNTGNVGVGTTTPAAKLTVSTNTQSAPAGQAGTAVQVVGANGTSARLLVDSFGAVISSVDMRRANNTASTPSALLNGDNIGQITWQGYGATSYNGASRAKILVAAAENYTDSAQGAYMIFQVAPRGGLNPLEAMRIDATGFVGLGTTAPAYRLDVSGTVNASAFTIGGTSVVSSQWANGSGGVINYAGGNVGVGVPVPNTKLDVGGTVNASAFTIGGVPVVSSHWTKTGTTINYASGNVGVGVPVPNTKLDVGGTVNASAFTVGGISVVSSQWATSGATINYATGNVGIATATPTEKLHVTGNIKVSGNIDVGGNINAKYQDLAEWVESSQELSAGTVVVLDSSKSNQVVASSRAYDSRVAGVVSRQPGIALGERGEGRILVATTGRVKVRVDATNGPIEIGDLLVTSEKTGLAMKSVPIDFAGTQIHRPGTLVGKALESLANGTGEILVLLSLQ
jgi:hypothetical protein